MVPLAEERLQGQARLAELDSGEKAGRIAAGAGWQRYPELWSSNADAFEALAHIRFPKARFLLPSARQTVLDDRLLDPAEVEPAYLRQDVATPPPRP